MVTGQRVHGLLVVLVAASINPSSAEVGDSCVLKSTGTSGICKISSDCPKAEEEAKRGISPTICGFFELNTPIVCCEGPAFSVEPNDNTLLNSPDVIAFPLDIEPDTTVVRKSEQKCQEYSKSVTGEVQAIALTPDSRPISINIEKCDYNGVALIVGGKPAGAGEFPFMAAVGFDVQNVTEWRCGGTLISENYVLTAAHCTFSRDAGPPKIVRLGDLDLTRDDDGSIHEDYAIRRIIKHPGYDYPKKYNDIALLQLRPRVKFTKFIRPACLYVKTQIEQLTAIATGWGRTDFDADNSDKLMKVSLNIYDNTVCEQPFRKVLPQGMKQTMLCAGELKGGEDTCQGDSGGPLIITKKENQCKFYIVGITSFGKSCGQENTAAVYTRVSEFVPWIEQKIW